MQSSDFCSSIITYANFSTTLINPVKKSAQCTEKIFHFCLNKLKKCWLSTHSSKYSFLRANSHLTLLREFQSYCWMIRCTFESEVYYCFKYKVAISYNMWPFFWEYQDLILTLLRDHSFKTLVIFYDFWPLLCRWIVKSYLF